MFYFIFLLEDIKFPQLQYLKIFFLFPVNSLTTLLNIKWLKLYVLTLKLWFGSIDLHVCFCQYHSVFILYLSMTLYCVLRSRMIKPAALSISPGLFWLSRVFYAFHMTSKTVIFSIFFKKIRWEFSLDCIEICKWLFGKVAIFTILTLPNHEQLSFYFPITFSVSFFRGLKLSL